LRTESSLLAQAIAERNDAQAALDRWREEWRLCVRALKRPGYEPPAGVERAIKLIEEAHRERQRVLELDHRIDGVRENIDRLVPQVAAVVVAAAPDLGRRPLEAVAQELRRRLDAQREVLARRDQLLRQQKTAREKLGEAEAGKRRAEAARESVRAEVDGETDEEIPARIVAAADRAQAEASLQHCEWKLPEIGDGRTIAALDTEIAAFAADLFDSASAPGPELPA
jgi:hypothetical protein